MIVLFSCISELQSCHVHSQGGSFVKGSCAVIHSNHSNEPSFCRLSLLRKGFQARQKCGPVSFVRIKTKSVKNVVEDVIPLGMDAISAFTTPTPRKALWTQQKFQGIKKQRNNLDSGFEEYEVCLLKRDRKIRRSSRSSFATTVHKN